MALDSEIQTMSACDIQQAVARRELTAAEVTLALNGLLEQVNPALNAICTVNDAAQAQAEACDARLRGGAAARPLEGVPVVVKDNIETAGLRTTFGSKLTPDFIPEENSVLVSRLLEAGAVILGKSNTPEFAADINTSNALFGQTRNPWDLNITPGGSSGGSAAAVAAGIAPIGIGTDLGGSIRLPAAFNGIVGLRPSPGRVPVYPQEFAWDTLIAHVQGPLARTIEDLALVYSVISGPDDYDPSTLPALPPGFWDLPDDRDAAVEGTRIAYIEDLNGLVPLDSEVRLRVDAAANDLATAGAVVEHVSFDASDLKDIISGTRSFNLIARLADRYDAHGNLMTSQITNQVEAAQNVDLRAVTQAERQRTAYWHRVRNLLEHYDFIMCPTVGVPAFRLDSPLPTHVGGRAVDHFYDVILTTYAFSITGLPALSVPCGFTTAGLPIGLQIVGPRQREDRVLALGAAYLSLHSEHLRSPPPIDASTKKPVSDEFVPLGVPVR